VNSKDPKRIEPSKINDDGADGGDDADEDVADTTDDVP
jgi:hypothetical protein